MVGWWKAARGCVPTPGQASVSAQAACVSSFAITVPRLQMQEQRHREVRDLSKVTQMSKGQSRASRAMITFKSKHTEESLLEVHLKDCTALQRPSLGDRIQLVALASLVGCRVLSGSSS